MLWALTKSTLVHGTSYIGNLYGGPGGRATRRCLCDDGDATIDDDDATIDDAVIYQLSNTVITHDMRAPDQTHCTAITITTIHYEFFEN